MGEPVMKGINLAGICWDMLRLDLGIHVVLFFVTYYFSSCNIHATIVCRNCRNPRKSKALCRFCIVLMSLPTINSVQSGLSQIFWRFTLFILVKNVWRWCIPNTFSMFPSNRNKGSCLKFRRKEHTSVIPLTRLFDHWTNQS